MNANLLPTQSAIRILHAGGIQDRFCDQNGKKTSVAWRDALAEFQKMIISGTEVDVAKMMLKSYIYYDPQQGDDQNDDFLESEFNETLDKIAEATKIDGRSILINELMKVAGAPGGSMSFFDGKTKMDAIKSLHEIIEGKSLSPEDERGLLIKLTGS